MNNKQNNALSQREGSGGSFKIRIYTKKELACQYFPMYENPHSAVNRLMSLINAYTDLVEELEQIGYQKSRRCFTSREVRLIVEYLGEP